MRLDDSTYKINIRLHKVRRTRKHCVLVYGQCKRKSIQLKHKVKNHKKVTLGGNYTLEGGKWNWLGHCDDVEEKTSLTSDEEWKINKIWKEREKKKILKAE